MVKWLGLELETQPQLLTPWVALGALPTLSVMEPGRLRQATGISPEGRGAGEGARWPGMGMGEVRGLREALSVSSPFPLENRDTCIYQRGLWRRLNEPLCLAQELAPVGPQQMPVVVIIIIVFIIVRPATLGKFGLSTRLLAAGV